MKNIWVTIKMVFTALGGLIGMFLGGLDGFVYALTAFIVIDYITGVMKAIVQKKLSSEIGFRGIFKKVLIFVLVGVGHMTDVHLIGNGSIVRTAVCCFYISNEGISLLENAAEIGLPIPQKLKDILTQIRKKGDKDNDNKPNDM